jgi:hypothetical protein
MDMLFAFVRVPAYLNPVAYSHIEQIESYHYDDRRRDDIPIFEYIGREIGVLQNFGEDEERQAVPDGESEGNPEGLSATLSYGKIRYGRQMVRPESVQYPIPENQHQSILHSAFPS